MLEGELTHRTKGAVGWRDREEEEGRAGEAQKGSLRRRNCRHQRRPGEAALMQSLRECAGGRL